MCNDGIIGLERRDVRLANYNPRWKIIAFATIKRLLNIFGEIARDIQHIGSTAIVGIQAQGNSNTLYSCRLLWWRSVE
ncbi:MAG: GrpB family protein [Defluviitaleaceae bacterium]|nr:GrpB family protein [Defluviitaleaceae bacterium]MCL2274192.1 GrpB family protein [Defluviitaleaceae bacterium]